MDSIWPIEIGNGIKYFRATDPSKVWEETVTKELLEILVEDDKKRYKEYVIFYNDHSTPQ